MLESDPGGARKIVVDPSVSQFGAHGCREGRESLVKLSNGSFFMSCLVAQSVGVRVALRVATDHPTRRLSG